MLAIEVRYPDGTPVSYREILALKKLLMKKRLVTEWTYIERVTSAIVLFPAFIFTDQQLDQIVERVAAAFAALEKRLMR